MFKLQICYCTQLNADIFFHQISDLQLPVSFFPKISDLAAQQPVLFYSLNIINVFLWLGLDSDGTDVRSGRNYGLA